MTFEIALSERTIGESVGGEGLHLGLNGRPAEKIAWMVTAAAGGDRL